MLKRLPNLLSITRILLAPILVLLYSPTDKMRFSLAMGVVLFALVTDFADGYLARALAVASEPGYVLDGLGDRAIYASIILIIISQQKISLTLAWILIFREILVYASRLLLRNWHQNASRARIYSKLHGGALRLWFLVYFLIDGFLLYHLPLGFTISKLLAAAQSTLPWITACFGYYHIYSQLRFFSLQETLAISRSSL